MILAGLEAAEGEADALVSAGNTGAAVLAQAGLLSGQRATLHWAHVPALAEAHPQVVFTNHLYELSRQRLSCAGRLDELCHLVAVRAAGVIEVLHEAFFCENFHASFQFEFK